MGLSCSSRSKTVQDQHIAPHQETYDVSNWSYRQLRNTIDTAGDLELVQACLDEFINRMEMYHAVEATEPRSGAVQNQHQGQCDMWKYTELKDIFSASFVEFLEACRLELLIQMETYHAMEARAPRSEAVQNQDVASYQVEHDLSKWKFSELRDTINTSSDIELLRACDRELRRRLEVYNQWRAKQRKRMNDNERAQCSILDAASQTPEVRQTQIVVYEKSQRYFRIPFVQPSTIQSAGDQGKRGLWFAHFDGQFVVRQMELHAEKPPILLVAGKDDTQMCELSLEETGLRGKPDAEIPEHEFNEEWARNGGGEYVRRLIASNE